MAPKDNELLRDILSELTTLSVEVKNINTRLFGAEGQKGCVPVLFDRTEALGALIQGVKDEALQAVQDTKDKDIASLRTDIADLKTSAKITLWKTGAISSLAGSGIGVAATILIKYLMAAH